MGWELWKEKEREMYYCKNRTSCFNLNLYCCTAVGVSSYICHIISTLCSPMVRATFISCTIAPKASYSQLQNFWHQNPTLELQGVELQLKLCYGDRRQTFYFTIHTISPFGKKIRLHTTKSTR